MQPFGDKCAPHSSMQCARYLLISDTIVTTFTKGGAELRVKEELAVAQDGREPPH